MGNRNSKAAKSIGDEIKTHHRIKAVFFDLDDTLFDSTVSSQKASANAVTAMIDAGLPASSKDALNHLVKIKQGKGSNYSRHYDELCKKYGISKNELHRIVAAGVLAYHNTKISSVVPFPDVHSALMVLVKRNIKIAIITNGIPKKQWEKIFRLGIDHLLDYVAISGTYTSSASKMQLAKQAMKALALSPAEVLWVGDRPDTDVRSANKLGIISVMLKRKGKEPKTKSDAPKFAINRVNEVLKIIDRLERLEKSQS